MALFLSDRQPEFLIVQPYGTIQYKTYPVLLSDAAFAGVGELLTSSGGALDEQQREDEHKGDARYLGGRGEVVHAEPDIEDAERQGLDRKVLDRAEVRHHLHEHQRQARHKAADAECTEA